MEPLPEQLQRTGEQARVLVPQLQRFLCFGTDPLRLLYDSAAPLQARTPRDPVEPAEQLAGAVWSDPLAQLQQQAPPGSVHGERHGAYLVVFQAGADGVFSPAETTAMAVFAELLAGSLERAVEAMEAMRLATEVAHEFARLRDFETGNHLERVSAFTRMVAEGVAERWGLSRRDIEQISLFSRLHDIGKVGIPDAILLKPGRLEPEEMAVMRTHVRKGLEILHRVLDEHRIPEQPATRLMANLIRTHHERLDGSGYPDGLRGEAIPIEGRIVAVADVFDAVTSTRPYRTSASVAEGLALLHQLAHQGQLDPDCVAALAAQPQQLEEVVARYRDAPALSA